MKPIYLSFFTKKYTTLSLFILLFGSSISQAQNAEKIDCTVLKNCQLQYVENEDKTAYIVILNDKHVEYYENGKYYIKSDLKWLNACEYDATMTEITLPNFPFQPGEVMHVTFERFEDHFVYGTGVVRGQKFPIAFKITKYIMSSIPKK